MGEGGVSVDFRFKNSDVNSDFGILNCSQILSKLEYSEAHKFIAVRSEDVSKISRAPLNLKSSKHSYPNLKSISFRIDV